ncbi:nucleotidyltransferase domain-containing protein [Amycolatopsis eburnea]|uniref:Nucleotidyltransferase n=1 Tax=Amycolatopsis eburnea TaxID=2267691 RepID=A0A3R9DRJ2_9PSEU|nr:nucleotidyltransferase [Amycolatopsis eburnea]RSD10310.1 nucleotidyltransferase [Amycolatopsis eburnea]
MATLATQFKAALTSIEPQADAQNAAKAHDQVTAALEADDRLAKLGISPVLIGSYGRDVSIKRVKDVDVFARLTKATSTLRPGKILDHVTEVLEEAFPGRVERQHRSVKVEFPDFDLSVDVVIARPCVDHPDEHWQIPQKIEDDGRASWVETNPVEMGELATAANKTFLLSSDNPKSGVYVHMVKLIRQIRRTWVDEQPGGYYFEVLTYHAFQNLKPNENTIADYLCVILREIADRLPDYVDEGPADPTLDDRTITTKATEDQTEAAAERIAEAAELAESARDEEDICASAAKWRELLGETQETTEPEDVFPLPDSCNADGSTKSARGVVKGASAVPAGRGRYA